MYIKYLLLSANLASVNDCRLQLEEISEVGLNGAKDGISEALDTTVTSACEDSEAIEDLHTHKTKIVALIHYNTNSVW